MFKSKMSEKEEKFLIDISKPKQDFDFHLTQPFNERIIFSGGFGTGKTYFLNEYFKNHKNYDVIHLYPVNYSIASNQDILELMKYDIGFELLRKGLDFEKISFDKLFTVQFFIQKEFNSILNIILENAAKAGKSIFPIGEVLVDLKKKFEELAKKFEEFHNKNSVDQEKELISYLKKFTGEKGSLYEEDNITILIRELVGQLKSSGKETILIIDDLDRIDPEHIFRLLNVFSAHFDISNTGNKFGFDKIILVCDVENIRNLFHAKYGMKVDFTGYIDKFYSKEIFKFDNLEVVSDSLFKILESIEVDEKTGTLFSFKNNNHRLPNEIHYILQGLIQANALNLRSIIKLYKMKFEIKTYEVYYGEKRRYNVDMGILVVFNFLKLVLGNDIALGIALHKAAQLNQIDFHDRIDSNNKGKLGNLIVILDIGKHVLDPNEQALTYTNELYNLKVTYQLIRNSATFDGVWVRVNEVNLPGNIKYFKLLEEVYQRALSLNMIK